MIVWDKMQHGTGDLKNAYAPQHELITFLTKGRRGFETSRPVDIIRHPKVQPEQLTHSCEKPIKLLQKLILTSSKKNDIVFDPFMGSGTTIIAALETGRKAIGIEINNEVFDKTCERIENILASKGKIQKPLNKRKGLLI